MLQDPDHLEPEMSGETITCPEDGLEARWLREEQILEAAHLRKIETIGLGEDRLSFAQREELKAELLELFSDDLDSREELAGVMKLIEEGLDGPLVINSNQPPRNAQVVYLINLTLRFAVTWALFFLFGLLPRADVLGLLDVLIIVFFPATLSPLFLLFGSARRARERARVDAIQPELRRVADQHNGTSKSRQQALEAVYRKHDANPLGGCMLPELASIFVLRLATIIAVGGWAGGLLLETAFEAVFVLLLVEIPYLTGRQLFRLVGARLRAGLAARVS